MFEMLMAVFRGGQLEPPPAPEIDDKKAGDELAALTKQWDVIVGVQKHFNDLEWRIRSLALTALTAIVGFALSSGVASRYVMFTPMHIKFGYPVFLAFAGAAIWTAFFMSDYKWYHPMLGGAGIAANSIEERLAPLIGVAADDLLSHQIFTASKNSAWRKGKETHSTEKLRMFYYVGYGVLVALVVWSMLDFNLPVSP